MANRANVTARLPIVVGPQKPIIVGAQKAIAVAAPEPAVVAAANPNGVSTPEPGVVAAANPNGVSTPEPAVVAAANPNGVATPEPAVVAAANPNGVATLAPPVAATPNSNAAPALKVGPTERPSARPSRAVPFAPRIVGRYLLCEAFAAGGMATVHLGRLMGPQGFSRTVAIKQLHPQYAHDPKFVAMFLDEARLASRVHHPNVVSPLDVISHPPDLFMVMDYVHGEPLSRLLRSGAEQPVPPRIAAAIIGQVLLGLHAAHEATGESGEPLEIVHRDVSPQNVLVTKDGVAKVVDFGIAKAKARSQQTERGMLKGKLGYMAPEQIRLDAVDRRADVFAVGVVLWEMLTGQRLFDGDTPDAVLHQLMHRPIPPPSTITPGLPVDLDAVVVAALSRSTEERFANARAMAQALDYATPSASMLELAAWVAERAGDELTARAELVVDVEALRFDDFTRSRILDFAPGTPLPAGGQKAEPVFSESGARHRLMAPASAPEGPEPSRVRPAPRRKQWFLVVAAVLIVLGGVAWGLARAQQRAAGQSAKEPSLVALPSPAHSVAGAPRAPLPEAAPLPVDAREATLPSRSPANSNSNSNSNSTSPSSPAPRHAAAVKSVATEAAATSARPVAKTAPDPCEVPYTVDKRGVKRFKEACF